MSKRGGIPDETDISWSEAFGVAALGIMIILILSSAVYAVTSWMNDNGIFYN